MNNASYRWGDPLAPIRICITDSPGPMKPHAQHELELMYFYSTSGCRYRCAGQELLFSAGELAVVNPGEYHACSDWGAPCRAVCIMIDLKKLAVPALSGLQFPNKIYGAGEHFRRLDTVLRQPQTPGRDCRTVECVYALLAELAGQGAPKVQTSPRQKELTAIAGYVSEHLAEPLSVADLAARIHLSEDRFYHVFREYFGLSPTAYVLSERIARACDLLAEPSLTVSDIARLCGFCSASYFSKKFRESMKLSPHEYRNRQNIWHQGS